ncbi:hypothetical protein CsatB_014118 [Cannabis sativa]
MGLKRIAKKVMGDVPEPSATKKRPIPNKVESRKAKRAKPSKSTKDVISDSDFENEMHDGREKPKVKSKIVVAWKLLPGCFQIAANLSVLSCCHPNAHCSIPKFVMVPYPEIIIKDWKMFMKKLYYLQLFL